MKQLYSAIILVVSIALGASCAQSTIGNSIDSGALSVDTSKEVNVAVLAMEPSNQGVCGDDVDIVLSVEGNSEFDLSKQLRSVTFGGVSAVILGVDEAENKISVRVPAQDPSGNFVNPSPIQIDLLNANTSIYNGFTYTGNCDCSLPGASPDIVSIEDIFVATSLDFDIIGSDFSADAAASMEGQPLDDLISVESKLIVAATPADLGSLCSDPPCTLSVQVSNGNGCSDTADVMVVDNLIPVYQTYDSSFQDPLAGQPYPREVYLGAGTVGLDGGSFAMLSNRRVIKVGPDKNMLWQRQLGDPLAGALPGAHAEVPCYGVAQAAADPSAKLANGKDIDGDGVADVIVYEHNYRSACILSGADGDLIFSMHDTVGDLPLSIPNGDDGFIVAGLGDLDGDGQGEFIVSREFIGFNFIYQAGKIDLYSIGNAGCNASLPADPSDCAPVSVFTGPAAANGFGNSIAATTSDIVIGSPKEDLGGEEGSIYVYRKTAIASLYGLGTNQVPHVLQEDQKVVPAPGSGRTLFGYRLSHFEEDGFLTVTSDSSIGKAVILGFKSVANSFVESFVINGADQTSLSSSNPGFTAGVQLRFVDAGDVDRDGLSDVLIGDYNFEGDDSSPERGRLSVYAQRSGSFEWILSLDAEDSPLNDVSGLGMSVAATGDINGDGYGEVVGGAPQYGPIPSGAGRVYLFNWLSDQINQIVTP